MQSIVYGLNKIIATILVLQHLVTSVMRQITPINAIYGLQKKEENIYFTKFTSL